MKAIYIKEFGGPENLDYREVADLPKPVGDQVLVRVRSSALNRADLLQRRGLYMPPAGYPERIPGLEFAGEIVELGEKADLFRIGERVMGITAGGGQAEFLLIEQGLLMTIPENLSFTQGAAIPEAFITAHDALFTRARLQCGEAVLIHAVGSGVGLAALQLAKAKDIRTVGTSRTAGKLEKAYEFALDQGILTNDATTGDPAGFAESIKKENDGKGVDAVLDLLGAKYLPLNLESLNLKGRLILIGTITGSVAELNFSRVMGKRLEIIGTVLRPRSIAEKAEATRLFAEDALPLFTDDILRPNIDTVFRADEIRKAHQYLESDQSCGKVVLEFQGKD